MDSSAWALLLPLSTVFLLSAIYYLFFSSSTSNKQPRLGRPPPSPRSAIPLLGNLLWLYKSLLELSPALRRLRSELGAPVVTFKFGLFPAIFVIDRALIHEALVQKGAIFGERPPVRGAAVIFSSNGHNVSSGRGAVWRALRRNLVSEMFHPSRLRAFADVRKWVLGRLLAELKEEAAANGGVVVFAKSFRRAMFRLLVHMCFGEKVDDATVQEIERVQLDLISIGLKVTVFDVLPWTGKILFWGTWRKFLAIRRRQEEIMIPLITSLRKNRHSTQEKPRLVSYVDSLIDLELHNEDGGAKKLTDDEIVSLCSEFFNAGTDTTAVTAEWLMANLVKYSDIQRRLAEEIAAAGMPASPNFDAKESEPSENEEAVLQKLPYLKAVILETLRRHPPAQFLLPHAAAEDATLGGGEWAVPKGAYVNFAIAEAGWDGAVWEEPWGFRPERFIEGGEAAGVDVTGSREVTMIPFGAGRRICPGMGLAMLHLEYFVVALVKEFEWLPPAEGEEIDLSEKLKFTVEMKNPLRARIQSRPRPAATGLA